MNILLVEDNPADVRQIQQLLRDSAYCDCTLLLAQGLAQALDVLAGGEVDLVLLDLSLPDADDLSAVAQVLGAAPALPVVVLTGARNDDAALRALRAGAQDYLVKDTVDSELLVRALRHARERKRLQLAERFLAEAGSLLAASLDYEDTLQNVGQLAVRFLADFCIIDIADDDGVLRRLHVAHANPADAATAARLQGTRLDASRPHLVFRVVEAHAPVLVSQVTDELLASIAQNQEHLEILRAMRPRSYLGVPMLARGRLIGALLFVSARRSYDADDVVLAEKLAHLAALEVDNARLYRAAQDAVRARDHILSIVAHDLRNPLNTIAMGLELMLDMPMSPELQERQLHVLRRTADRMNRLIQDLLDVGRLRDSRLQLQKQHLDAARLAREATELSSVLAAVKEQTLHCEAGETALHVLADYDRVLRVLQNLLDNAIKFTPRGGRITVRVARQQDEVCFAVADTGPGLPAEQRAQIFQPFWQARRGSTEGAGLGLAIARGLVEAHGGRIWAESEVGEGTTLCFTLPAAAERRAETSEPAGAPGQGAGAAQAGSTPGSTPKASSSTA